MVGLTSIDTREVSFATPEEFRDASQKALNFWVGAMSPLWAPFWAATAFGVGIWTVGQGLKRTGITNEVIDGNAHLAARWPGFALPFAAPFATPWSRGYGQVAQEVDAVVDIAQEALSAPVQIAFETEEKLEAAAEEAVQTAEKTFSDNAETIAEAVPSPEDLADKALEPVHAVSQAAEEAADAVVAETVEAADVVADTVSDATRPLIDPVSEAPIIPAFAEATAEGILPGLPTPARRPRRK